MRVIIPSCFLDVFHVKDSDESQFLFDKFSALVLSPYLLYVKCVQEFLIDIFHLTYVGGHLKAC